MTDQNRKTLRSFYCRDYLWEHFEQMAQELGCSMDYLINESMRHYARSRDYGAAPVAQPEPAISHQPAFSAASPQGVDQRFDVGGGFDRNQGMNHRTFERVPALGGPGRGAPQPPPPGRQPEAFSRGPGGPPPPPPRPSSAGGWPNPAPPSPPQPAGGFSGGPAYGGQPGAGMPPLYLTFNNNRYVISQEQYVIGRGSEGTDLTIRDGNISRRHCAVIYRNGAYYIKDMGSTNGVEYHGNRIESKKIEEGDVFFLCDYELRFSYRG